jgi:membrane protease subunit HflC
VQRLLIIILIVVVFLAFMVTYTVRFTEKAVVTTFGRADEKSVITEPGLRFKIPYFQQVTKYDSRARYMESNQETQQTADDAPILVTAYLTWRVEDPLKFFRAFSRAGDSPKDHYIEAEKTLKSKLRSALGEVSRFRFGELFSADEKGSRIAELEQRVLSNLDEGATADGALADFGVKALSVGILRMGLPQGPTRDVFTRMNAERKRIADKAVSEGQSQALALRSRAESDASKIRSFAEQLASNIRGQGEIEAAEWIKKLNVEPRLAVFLRQMKFMTDAVGGRTTIVLPTSQPGLEMFKPDALKGLKAGEIPGASIEPATNGGKGGKPAAAPSPEGGQR